MYGVGHGGIEAMLLAGMACVNNLVIAMMINGGQAPMLLSLVGADSTAYQQTLSQLMAVSTTPSWQFYMVGLERISAIIFHISASYLVYLAVSRKKLPYYLLSILLLFLLDALVFISSGFLSFPVTDALFLLFSGVLGYEMWRMYHASHGQRGDSV